MLDPVREKFCREYHKTGNASEAYRRANPKSVRWTVHTLHVKASKILNEDEVRMRLQALQSQAAERHAVSVASLTAELDEDRQGARDTGQYAAAISAVMGKAKLHGLLVDKVRDVTDDTDTLTDAELAAHVRAGSGVAASQANGKAKLN